jgi:GntR family transcriptional regulator, carbon starvation induced regulator
MTRAAALPRQTSEGMSTLTDQAYWKLRSDILTGRLAPGIKLRIEHLKTSYGIGASPIREALSRLSGDGFVAVEERRGFFVAPVSLEELWDVTEMRVDLETKALRKSIERGDADQWEAAIVASFHRLSRLDGVLRNGPPDEEWEIRHEAFHAALVAACDSRWLLHFRALLFDQSERYRRLSLVQKQVERDVPAEHRAIMEATLDRDAERAVTLLAEHIRRTAEIVATSVEIPG